MENFKVQPTNIKDHSLIEWDHNTNGIPLRSLQVETEIANLWAAAPEMLEALKYVKQSHSEKGCNGGNGCRECNQAYAVIAKAERGKE